MRTDTGKVRIMGGQKVNVDVITEKQEAELDSFEEKQRRSFERGRLLVYLIVGINILFDIIMIVILREFEFLKFVVHVALSVALIYGVTWVRYLYAIAGILTVVVSILALPSLVVLSQIAPGTGFIVAVLVLAVVYSAASSFILLFSKSVKEYMYTKKSERL